MVMIASISSRDCLISSQPHTSTYLLADKYPSRLNPTRYRVLESDSLECYNLFLPVS